MAAAALAALELVIAEPERTARVKENGKFFLETAKKLGLNTGRSTGNGVIALMIGGSLNTIAVSVDLLGRGFNVMPLIYPAVEEKQARLRFFVTRDHCHEDIEAVLQAVDQSIRSVRKNPILATANAIT